MNSPEDIKWLLERVRAYQNDDRRPSTHRNIWAGSYDVWSCEQDRIDAVEIPKARMKEAQDRGLIESHIQTKGKYQFEVWKLTPQGEVFLESYATR